MRADACLSTVWLQISTHWVLFSGEHIWETYIIGPARDIRCRQKRKPDPEYSHGANTICFSILGIKRFYLKDFILHRILRHSR